MDLFTEGNVCTTPDLKGYNIHQMAQSNTETKIYQVCALKGCTIEELQSKEGYHKLYYEIYIKETESIVQLDSL